MIIFLQISIEISVLPGSRTSSSLRHNQEGLQEYLDVDPGEGISAINNDLQLHT